MGGEGGGGDYGERGKGWLSFSQSGDLREKRLGVSTLQAMRRRKGNLAEIEKNYFFKRKENMKAFWKRLPYPQLFLWVTALLWWSVSLC